jgi:hypothetical protein
MSRIYPCEPPNEAKTKTSKSGYIAAVTRPPDLLPTTDSRRYILQTDASQSASLPYTLVPSQTVAPKYILDRPGHHANDIPDDGSHNVGEILTQASASIRLYITSNAPKYYPMICRVECASIIMRQPVSCDLGPLHARVRYR